MLSQMQQPLVHGVVIGLIIKLLSNFIYDGIKRFVSYLKESTFFDILGHLLYAIGFLLLVSEVWTIFIEIFQHPNQSLEVVFANNSNKIVSASTVPPLIIMFGGVLRQIDKSLTESVDVIIEKTAVSILIISLMIIDAVIFGTKTVFKFLYTKLVKSRA